MQRRNTGGNGFGEVSQSQIEEFFQMVQKGLIDWWDFEEFLNRFRLLSPSLQKPRCQRVYYNFPESYKRAKEIMRDDFIGIEHVVSALQWKGVTVSLTKSDLEKYSTIPVSEETLIEVAARRWRDNAGH